MTPKIRKVIGWVLTSLLTLVFIGSAAMKLAGGEAAVSSATSMGLSAPTLQVIGLVELSSLLLFIFPRTGILGTLLLTAYLGGAIATHLEHQQPIFVPIIIEALLWITAIIRFTELSRRLAGNKAEHQKTAFPSTHLAHA